MRAVLRIGLNVGAREPSAQWDLTDIAMCMFSDATFLSARIGEWQGVRERCLSYGVTYHGWAAFQMTVEALARALRQECVAIAYDESSVGCWMLVYGDGAISGGATFHALPLDDAERAWLG